METKRKATPPKTDTLRRKAEMVLSKNPKAVEEMDLTDMKKLVHELQVHQVELEMQNDELRKAQMEIEESQSRYADLYDFAPVGYLTLSSNGVILEANLTAADLLGVARRSLNNLLFSQFVAPEFRTQFMQYKTKVLQVENRLSCELRLIRRDRTLFWAKMDSMAVKDGEGNPSRMRTAVTDISALKAECVRLAAAVEQAGEGVVITDLKGSIEYINPSFERVGGMDPQKLHEWNYLEILGRDGAEEGFRKKVEETVQGGKSWSGHVSRKKGDGLSRELDVAISAIKDASGAAINYLAVERDVTEEWKLQEYLRQRQKMEALGTLAGGITHDFNNILASIAINAGLALEDSPQGSRMRRYLDMVLEGANRGRDLVKQIIAFSRQKEQERKPVRIAPVIEEGLKFLRLSLAKNIEISDSLEKESDVVVADPIQIYQILMNLCSNAAYAMREKGGRLGIRLAKVEVDEEISGQNPGLKPGPYLNLSVSDTGTGMTREVAEKAFDPFFTTKKPGEGTGMGLAVVHGIVRNHGGAVTVYSEVGTGSTFNVFLPRAGGEPEKERIPTGPIPRGTERILVVEDEKAQAESEQNMLERIGYNVVLARNGLEALEAFRKDPQAFDLVITDQTMPKMTGSELAAALLKIRPEVPIILCTGFSEIIDADEARAMGIREFVMKPFTVREMAETIRRVLDKEN